VTLTAAVQSAQGPVQVGTVEFLDGTTDLGPATVNSQGVATLQVVLGVGSHTVVAVYSGTPSLHTSQDTASITVGSSGPAATITSLTASALSLDQGQEVTLSAVVSSMTNGTLHPVTSGTVMFLDGGTVFASAAIDRGSGTAMLETVLGPGQHTITAAYLGDTGLAGSSSTPLGITVQSRQTPLTGDVSALVQTAMVPTPGGPRGRRGLTQVLNVLNTSGQSLEGPLYVVIRGLKPGVTLRGAAGFVGSRKKKSPFLVISPTGGTVKANDLVTALLRFSAKPKGFTLSVFAGLPPA
jgi:hypothetical protein